MTKVIAALLRPIHITSGYRSYLSNIAKPSLMASLGGPLKSKHHKKIAIKIDNTIVHLLNALNSAWWVLKGYRDQSTNHHQLTVLE